MSQTASLFVLLVSVALAGCARTEKQPLTANDCQVEGAGGSIQTEVSTVFEAEAQGRVGGVTVRNTEKCKGVVRVFTRTATSAACVGEDDAWCREALKAQPIPLTTDQIGDLMRQLREAEGEQ